tara:strand:- start:137 stop:1645 length:1509 start_codon:yes stop_codon:yes gene_type:complete
MTAIITEKFKQHNATQFYESFSEASATTYYMLFGKATPFTSATSGGTDDLPPTPADDVSSEFYVWDQITAGKNIAAGDVSYAIPRRDWANSTTYDMYEDNISTSNLTTSGASNLYNSTFFFRTSDNRIYKVIDNNAGTAYSGTEPSSESTSPFAQGGYILKYMYTVTAAEQTKFLTTDFMPVSTDTTVSAAATDGKIESLIITAGSGYEDGTYYTAIQGDGTSAGTSSGAIVKFIVSSGAIASYGLTDGTDTTIYAAGAAYTYGTTNLSDDTVFTGTDLTGAVTSNDIDGGSGGAIQVVISPKNGHGYDAVKELGGHYVMMNTLFIGAERDDLLTGNDFRNISIAADPTTYGTSTVASDSTIRQTYAVKLTSVAGTFSDDEKISQATTGSIGKVVEWDSSNSILYYQQERYGDYGTNSTTGDFTAFSGENDITGATSAAVGTPDASADSAVTLANGYTLTFTDGYANPELQPDSGDIIYNENRSPISRATDQTEDIKIIVEF